MGDFLTVLWRMSWQASIIIVVIVALRKIYELLHIEKKYVMLLWIIPFFCLICPLKISIPHGFWQDSLVELSYEQEDIVVQLGDSYIGDKTDTLNGNENIKFENLEN